MEIQLGFQPRVLHPQETSIHTTESEGERLGPNCRHKDLVQQTQPRYLLPTGEDRVFQGIARVVSIGSDWADIACRLQYPWKISPSCRKCMEDVFIIAGSGLVMGYQMNKIWLLKFSEA